MCAKPRRLLVRFFSKISEEQYDDENKHEEKEKSVANESDITVM